MQMKSKLNLLQKQLYILSKKRGLGKLKKELFKKSLKYKNIKAINE